MATGKTNSYLALFNRGAVQLQSLGRADERQCFIMRRLRRQPLGTDSALDSFGRAIFNRGAVQHHSLGRANERQRGW